MMRSIFSSRRQSTIQSSSKSESVALPLPPQKPPEAENQNSQNMNQEKTKNKMPKMEVFASKLEETCRSLLTRVVFIFKDFKKFGSKIFKNHKWIQKKIRRSNHMGLISLYSRWKTSCIGWFFYTRWRSTNQRWELFSIKWTMLFVELLFGLWNAWWRKNKNFESEILLRAIESKVFIRKSNFKKVFRFAADSSWSRWVFTSPRW